MATPITLGLLSDIGLKIKINKSKFHGIDCTDTSMPWQYTVTNYGQICPSNCTTSDYKEDLKGWLSPTSPVTLSPIIKDEAGIPKEATSYGFMYPPQGLAKILSQQDLGNNFGSDAEIEPLQDNVERMGIKSAAILGGFAYFDKNCECIRINALSLERPEGTLRFSGPFKVNQSACDELYKLRRPQPLQLDIFHEVGFVSFAWVRPKESFQFKSVFVTDGHTNSHPNNNGTMIFFRENGTGEAYAVDQSEYIDTTGYVGIISDAFRKISKAELTEQVIQPIAQVKDWGDKVKCWKKIMDIDTLVRPLEDKKRLLHMACHATLGGDFVSDVLSHFTEKSNLLYQDSFGWNPLHYACRFSPSDSNLIKLLVTECPKAVVQLDYYYRSPLHIACNSDTSEEVIAILLDADTSIPKVTINKKTRRFGLLPLHLACYNGASEGIIHALLDADCNRMTVIEKSWCRQLPLHLAILKKLPAGMVKAFLDADAKLSNVDRSTFGVATPNFDVDIYQSFDGTLPLHSACLNNSSSEIIQLLLEKDKHNTTINEKVNELPHSFNMGQSTSPWRQKRAVRKFPSQFLSSDHESEESSEGVVALHLAMRHGSTDVIHLLIQKEMEKVTNGTELSMLHKTDSCGRTPLHIACQHNVGSHIIHLLLKLDPYRKTTQIQDRDRFMPIHYACENKDTSAETINILLDAEDKYIKITFEKGVRARRSTHTGAGDTERGRTPLYLAVKAGAETQVIERLLQPEHLYLNGFDDSAMTDLANIVKRSKALQEKVVNTLSERSYFCLLLLEFYACIVALVCFIIGSDKLVKGTISVVEPCLLVICGTVFILRELLQIKSVGANYIGDVWSWVEIVGIILLLCTSSMMFQEVSMTMNYFLSLHCINFSQYFVTHILL